MNNDNFDDIIKQKADNHQAPFPADAWDNIAKKKKRKLFPFFWFSLSALLFAGVIVTYNYSNKMYNYAVKQNSREQAISKLQNSKTDNNNNVNATKNNTVLINRDAQSDLSEKDNLTGNKNSKHNHIFDQTIKTNDNSIIANKNNQYNKQPLSTHQLNNNVRNNTVDNVTESENRIKASKALNSSDKKINNNSAYSKRAAYNKSNKVVVPKKIKTNDPTFSNVKNEIAAIHKKEKHTYNQRAKYKASIINGRENDDDDLNNNITATINKIIDGDAKPNKKTASFSDTISMVVKQQPKVADSLLNKKGADSLKTNNQNKVTAVKANKTKFPLFVDCSIIPFASIQQYDQPVSVIQINNNSNVRSTYAANTVKTSLLPAVAFALTIKKNINKKLTVGVGIQFSKIEENIKMSGAEVDTNYTDVKRLVTNNGNPYLKDDTVTTIASGNKTITATNSYRVFSFPLFVTYTFYNHKLFSVGATGGICLNVAQYHNAISGKLQSVYTNGIQNSGSNCTVDILAGVHFSWNLNKKYQLFAEPDFRYSLDKYALKNAFINKNINQVGLSLGVSYKIK